MIDLKLEKDEKLIKIINEHWMKYVPSAIIGFLLTGIGFILFFIWFIGKQETAGILNFFYIFSFNLFFYLHHWFFLILFSEAMGGIILTTKRIIYIRQTLFFSDIMQDISYEKIKTVKAETNGLLHNILHYGNLRFDPEMFIPLVPHPNSVVKEIEQMIGMK